LTPGHADLGLVGTLPTADELVHRLPVVIVTDGDPGRRRVWRVG
jgi:hypothetical protein